MAERAIRTIDDPSSIGMRLLRKHLESGYSVKKQLDKYSGKMKTDIASAYGDQALKRGEYQTAMKAYEVAGSSEKLLGISSVIFSEKYADEKTKKVAIESMNDARKMAKEENSAHGKIVREAFYSKSLGKEKNYNVYLPPGYENSKERLPVVYLFHGTAGNQNDWPVLGKIHKTADELISKGLIKKTIIVMPDTDNGMQLKSSEIPKRFKPLKPLLTKGDYDGYIANDLVSDVDQ